MIEYFICEQGTPEWHAYRLGIPTASEFAAILSKGRGGEESRTRRTYLMKLIGERITGEPMYSYSNDHMERGKEMEAEALSVYEFMTDQKLSPVGFIKNHALGCGCSPDGAIQSSGLVEVKTKLAHLQAEVLLAQEMPSEHRPQVQGQLWVAEKEFVDFVSYWPKMPLFIKRIYRDEPYIKLLAEAVKIFQLEIGTLHNTIMGGPIWTP